MPSHPSLKRIKTLFFLLFIAKLFMYVWLTVFKTELLQISGNDSDFYNDFALGFISDKNASSIWPFILRGLNDVGFYNRKIISWLLFALGSLVIPFVFAAALPTSVNISHRAQHQRLFWSAAILVSLYPTIFYFTFDIYRDVIMILIFGLCLFVARYAAENSNKAAVTIPLLLLLSYLLYSFRAYLGFAVLIAFPFYWFNWPRLKFFYLIAAYFLVLMVLQSLGCFDSLLSYRARDGFVGAGSTLGIGLMGKNPIEFLFLYTKSGVFQLFGLYLISIKAWMAFFLESALFITACLYIIKNKQFLTPLLRCILVFSVIYGTIWILGNDNLGTAVRLRIYNYLSILIVAASICFLKYVSSEAGKSDMSAKGTQ